MLELIKKKSQNLLEDSIGVPERRTANLKLLVESVRD